jgi:hypothetical protein
MGLRSWIIELKNAADLKNLELFCKDVHKISGVDNLPMIVGAVKLEHPLHGRFGPRGGYGFLGDRGTLLALLQTDGDTSLTYLDRFGFNQRPYRLESITGVEYTAKGTKIIGAHYFETHTEFKKALRKK